MTPMTAVTAMAIPPPYLPRAPPNSGMIISSIATSAVRKPASSGFIFCVSFVFINSCWLAAKSERAGGNCRNPIRIATRLYGPGSEEQRQENAGCGDQGGQAQRQLRHLQVRLEPQLH